MDKERLENLIAALVYVRSRPKMYFSHDVEGLRAFVSGIHFTCQLLGVELQPEYARIWMARGRRRSNQDAIHEMQHAGIPIEDIILEEFEVLILTIQRKYGVSTKRVLELHQQMRERKQSYIASSKTIDDHHRERMEREFQAMEKLERELGISSANSEDK